MYLMNPLPSYFRKTPQIITNNLSQLETGHPKYFLQWESRGSTGIRFGNIKEILFSTNLASKSQEQAFGNLFIIGK